MRDSQVRSALKRRLDDAHAGDAQTRIVEEMPVWSGTARIDVAVINGLLCGYEIKSDRDTLERLPLQIKVYGKIFDHVTLVVGAKHAKKSLEMIPAWWGVIVARQEDNEVRLFDERIESQNLEQEPALFAELVGKSEALSLLASHGLDRGWRSRPIRDIHQRLADNLPFELLKEGVRETIKKRRGWLRENGPGQLDVAVDPDRHPVL
jgi:hypothetical protein